jgi:uncharacterized protein YqeY
MSLKDTITEDMKQAMRAKDSARLSAIRLLLAAIKQKEVDERISLDDAQILGVIDKMAKQRKDSMSQFEAAGRTDLVDKERAELAVIQTYLPQQASAQEVQAAIEAAIVSVGAMGPQDMGKVMGVLRSQLAGRADIGAVSGQLKQRLSQPR